ncbi:MAG: TIGR02996 domain-containing protein, partial [Planctomycetaceae bacterium]|nr:TIGR02996 domain-containing protein [Planctomycetaceae bacterium]
MSNEDEFLNRIRADRDNPVPYLVYADWLDDQGDPRGEFIRIQCELEEPHLPRGRARMLRLCEKELLDEHRDDWLGALADS